MDNLIEIKDFDILPGTSIREAIKEATRIADYNQCVIRFNFNGIEIKVYDFSDIEDLVDYYGHRLGVKNNE
jgi:hypothetical protein